MENTYFIVISYNWDPVAKEYPIRDRHFPLVEKKRVFSPNEYFSVYLHISNLCNVIIKVSFSESFSVASGGAFYLSLLCVVFLNHVNIRIQIQKNQVFTASLTYEIRQVGRK